MGLIAHNQQRLYHNINAVSRPGLGRNGDGDFAHGNCLDCELTILGNGYLHLALAGDGDGKLAYLFILGLGGDGYQSLVDRSACVDGIAVGGKRDRGSGVAPAGVERKVLGDGLGEVVELGEGSVLIPAQKAGVSLLGILGALGGLAVSELLSEEVSALVHVGNGDEGDYAPGAVMVVDDDIVLIVDNEVASQARVKGEGAAVCSNRANAPKAGAGIVLVYAGSGVSDYGPALDLNVGKAAV